MTYALRASRGALSGAGMEEDVRPLLGWLAEVERGLAGLQEQLQARHLDVANPLAWFAQRQGRLREEVGELRTDLAVAFVRARAGKAPGDGARAELLRQALLVLDRQRVEEHFWMPVPCWPRQPPGRNRRFTEERLAEAHQARAGLGEVEAVLRRALTDGGGLVREVGRLGQRAEETATQLMFLTAVAQVEGLAEGAYLTERRLRDWYDRTQERPLRFLGK